MKVLNRLSNSSIISLVGEGRENRTCVILDICTLLTIVIFLYGVKNLAFHMDISFCISVFFLNL